MIYLDLALQGMHELSGAVRVRLQSGYNAVVCQGVRPETLIAGLIEMLFAEGFDPEAKKLAAPGAKQTGGGVTMMTSEGATYRVVRDLTGGGGQLLEFDREGRKFKEVSTDPPEITQFLRGRVGLPGRKAFEAAFVLRPSDLPSQANKSTATPGEPEAPDPVALAARLATVEKGLVDAKAVEKMEFELDGMQKQRFELEDKLRALAFDRTALNEAEEEAKRLRRLRALPDDFGPRYEAYLKLVERRDADLKRWQAERDTLEHATTSAPVDPLLSDWRLWVGLAVGCLAVLTAFVGGILRWAAVLDIPSFGLAAFVLYQNLSQREQRDAGKRKLALSDQRKERILERVRVEAEAVEALLREAGLSKPEEVRDGLARRLAVQRKLEQLREAERRATEEPRLLGIIQKRDQLGEQIAAFEERLSKLGTSGADAAALRSEAERLRAALARAEKARPVTRVEQSGTTPMAAWLKVALELLLTDPAGAAKALSERAALIVRALSTDRLSAVILGADGGVRIQSTGGGAAAWSELPPVVQDLAYLALRGALFLCIEERSRLPLLCGELAGSVAGGVATSQILLNTLGQAGQLVHLVRRAEDAPQAKHVVNAAPGSGAA